MYEKQESLQDRLSAFEILQSVKPIGQPRTVLAHIIIGCSLLATETILKKIPKPVLDGLFLFLGLSGLYGNQLFERILLVFTEQEKSFY